MRAARPSGCSQVPGMMARVAKPSAIWVVGHADRTLPTFRSIGIATSGLTGKLKTACPLGAAARRQIAESDECEVRRGQVEIGKVAHTVHIRKVNQLVHVVCRGDIGEVGCVGLEVVVDDDVASGLAGNRPRGG